MSKFNFYFLRSKITLIWSLRIKTRTFTLRVDKIGRWWRPKFITYQLYDLDITGLYYEVGLVKLKENKE